MSTHALYFLEPKTDVLKTKVFFHEIIAIVKSLESNQFVIKFDSKNDLRLQNEERDDLIFFILNRFANQCPDLNLKVYGIPKPDLSSYCIYDKAVIKAQMKAR